MYQPSIVIPVFNHHQKINEVVAAIVAMGYVCFLIDDGSDAHCKEVLQDINSKYSTVYLQRFEINRGKGFAVCAGLHAAYEAGYSCALQIDADGQHKLEDIPAFFALAKDFPEYVIAGIREYGDVPKSRFYGRMLTDLWVWINTLSFKIKDSMCGFRAYPLRETIDLLNKVAIGERMNFDTDIIVRLYWEGVGIKQLRTKVLYDDQVPSHFDLLSDNLRISYMHARLFFGMLVRLPKLLARHFE